MKVMTDCNSAKLDCTSEMSENNSVMLGCILETLANNLATMANKMAIGVSKQDLLENIVVM